MYKLLYENDDKPPLLPLLMYGLQWLLVTIPSILIIGAVVAQFHYDGLAEQIFYTQKLFAIVGIGLSIQVLWGHRLPIVIGPASVLLIGILSSQSDKVSEIYTAIAIGGLLMLIVSFIKPLLNQIPKIFTSRIIIVILALIAFTLMPSIIRLVFSEIEKPMYALVFALLSLFLMILANKWLKGIWKSTVVLWAILLGSLLYYVFFDTYALETKQDAVQTSFFLFTFKFDAGIVLSFVFCYLGLFINELGSIKGVAKAIGIKDDESNKTRRGLRITGIVNTIAGAMGVIGVVDFSFSPGVIMSTACASRYTLLPAGIGLVLAAFFPSIIAFFLQIPDTIMGIILLFLMVSQLAVSLQMIKIEEAVSTFEQSITVALPLMLALFIAFLPSNISQSIPILLRPILGNAFVVGVLAVLILEHGIFRLKK